MEKSETMLTQKEIVRSESRDNNLNIIRFAAALMVIYGHMFPLLGIPSFTVLNTAISSIGVLIFFVISGYLISESYKRDTNALRYTIRRTFRIMPGLIFAILITALVIGPIFTSLPVREYFSNPNFLQYFKNMALNIHYNLPGVFEMNPYANAVNGSLWSLPVEVVMYIVMPIFLFAFSKCKKSNFWMVVITILVCLFNILLQNVWPDFNFVVYGMSFKDAMAIIPYFFLGYLFTMPKFKKLLNLQAAIVMLAVCLMIKMPPAISTVVLYIMVPYVVLSLGFAPKPVFKEFGRKNDLSYGMYLYGFLVQQMLINVLMVRLQVNIPFAAYIILATLGTLLFAALSWFAVEKPMQDLGKRLLKSEKIAAL